MSVHRVRLPSASLEDGGHDECYGRRMWEGGGDIEAET